MPVTPCDTLSFSAVLQFLRSHPMKAKAFRAGWDGKGQWIALMDGLQLPPFNTQDTFKKVNDRTAGLIGPDAPLNSQPYFVIYNGARQTWQPGWLPSQADLLSDDWQIITAA